MALQALANKRGILLHPSEPNPFSTSTITTSTLDAAGESVALIGNINLSTGPSTSKVLSAAGSGKIHWYAGGGNVFANGGTNLRIGVNDVDATGIEDGTHDVFGDWVGGTDTITSSSINTITMESGTKTIAHGDLVAIVIEMTTRGGADSVLALRHNVAVGTVVPYGTVDIGAGPVRAVAGGPFIGIEFDDGTFGWMDSHIPARRTTSVSFSNASTPDEYALVFQLPCRAIASGLWGLLTALAATDDFEMILYSDPLGTPVAERTIVQDMSFGDVGSAWSRPFSSLYTLEANTKYAIAYRPTTANTLGFHILDMSATGANIRKSTPLGTNWSQYSRTNQTGAFATEVTTTLPQFGIWLSDFEDGASSGGGGPLVGGRLVK